MLKQIEIQMMQDRVTKIDHIILADIKRIKEGCKEANERESNKRYNYIEVQ